MAEAAVAIFLETMSQLEIYHADLISGAENELKLLKKDLALLRAFLRDEAMNPKNSNSTQLRQLKTQIKEVVYKLDETVGVYLSHSAPKTKKVWGRLLSMRHGRLGKEVNSLRDGKVKNLLEDVKKYNITTSTSTSVDRLRTPLTTEQRMRSNSVVGLKHEVETITGYLMQTSDELDIVSIIGKPGLGKTTLARKIFEDERIACKFQNRIWVHVSRKFEIRDMFLNILKMFTRQDMSSLKDEELSENVEACLRDEKFLLVLDDLCSVSDWEAVCKILPRKNEKSKVLITSSANDVAANRDVKLHNLRGLDLEESWELLQLMVFGNFGICPPQMVEVGKRIVGKCEGLPLHIVAVAGILVDRLNGNEWEMVLGNLNKYEEILTNVAELSYIGFPDDLGECFLYMGVFPQDYEITTWTLTHLWIAEGLVQPEEGKSLEEIAMDYLDVLTTRNLVVAGKFNSSGEVKTCRMHDAIRAFCISKSKELNLIQKRENPRTGLLEGSCFKPNFLSELTNGTSQVGTFSDSHEQRAESRLQYLSATLAAGFRKLRILGSDSKDVEFNKLINLRYLTLKIDTLTSIPESITQLWSLQTLVVEAKSHSITMKANVWRMIWLRHIKSNAAIVLSPEDEGVAGENLQTFNTLSLESCTEDHGLKRACNLKALGIRGRFATHSGEMFLENLERLEKLKLVNDQYDEVATDNYLVHLLQPTYLPPYLKRLTLSNTYLDWMQISNLAEIKTLNALKLKENAFTGIYWSVADDQFPSLQLLLIDGTDLVHWEASTKSFPKLSCLVLKHCQKLNEIPMPLAKEGLEILHICRLRKSAMESAKRIAEEIKQVQESGNAKSMIPFKLSIGPGGYC